MKIVALFLFHSLLYINSGLRASAINDAVSISAIQMGPTVVCQPDTIEVNNRSACLGIVFAEDFDNGSTGEQLTFSLNPEGPFPPGTSDVYLIATDINGVKDSCLTTITVIDPPDLRLNSPTIFLNASGNASIDPLELVDLSNTTTECGNALVISDLTVSQTNFNCNDVGSGTALSFDGSFLMKSKPDSLNLSNRILTSDSLEISFLFRTEQQERAFLLSRMANPGGIAGPERFNYLVWIEDGNLAFLTMHNLLSNPDLISINSAVLDNELSDFHFKVNDGKWYQVRITMRVESNVTKAVLFVEEYGSSDPFRRNSASSSGSQFEFYIEPDRDGASPYLFYLGGVHEFNNERFIGDIDDLRIVSYGREVLYHDFEQTNESKASAITDKSLSDIHYDGIPSDFTLVPDVSSSKQVMVTITDQDGITDSAMTFVTVLDSIYTTFLAEGQQLILDENGQGSILLGSIDTTSFDACGVRSIRFVDLGQSTLTIRDTLISAECSDLGAQTVGVIATDVNSNQDTASITIEVLENTFLNTINHIAVLEENDSVFVAPNDFVSRDPFTSCVGTGGVTDLTMINQSVYTCDDLINTGGMIRFDGIDDQISIEESSDLVLDGSITLEAWIRTTKDSGIQQVITKPAGGDPASYSLNLQNGLPTISIYALGFPESQPAGMGSTVVSDGLWHHLAGVFDHEHDSIFLYVDGILQVAALIQSRSRFVGNDGLFIGNFSEFTDQHFEGDIDEIRIWNVPRTADEISRNFTVPLQGDEPGLIAYYNFDEVPGTSQAFDGTDGGNNGRLTNMESVSARQNRYLGFEKIILNAESSGANTSDTVFLILQDTITGNCVGKQEVTGRIGIDCNENLQGFAYSFDDPDRDVEDPVRELHFNDVPVNLFREGITLEAWVKTSGRAFMPGNFGFGQKFHLLSIDHITSQEVARELRLMLDPTSGFTAEYIGDFLPNFSLLTQEEPVFDGLDRLPLHYDEQWHHTAVTLNRNRMSFYVDGVLIRSFNINVPAGGIFPSGIPIRVISGRKSIATIQNVVPNLYSSAEELYTGNDTDAQIDELRVWSSARTPQEIFENYNVSLIGDEPNLELYVNFEEPAGEISDLSRNNFTGSLINQGISDGMPVPFADPSDWVTRSTPGLQNATVQFVLDQDGSVTFDSDLFAFNCPTEQIVESLSTNSFDCDDLNVRENAIGLNGSNAFGFVEENSVMDLQQSFTTSGWVRATNSTGIQRLFVKIRGSAQNYSLLLRDGVPEAVYNGAEGTVDVFARGTERIDDGLWHFISAVRSAETNTFSLYVDAELVTRVDGSVTPDNGDQGFFIGNAGLFGQYLNGELDDISIWETTRNEEELLAEMRSGPDTSDPDLVAHYGFEDAEGLANAVLIDESDNSLSGTLTDYVVPSVTARRSIGIQELSVNTRDANNNLLDYQVTAIIQDTIPPLVNVQFVTVFLGEDGTVTLSSDDFVQSAQDSCDSLNYFFSQPVLTCEDLGSNQIDLVAEDQGGNQVNAVFTVVVADTITAVLEIEDQMLALGESDQVVVPFDDLIPERVDCRITDYTLELVSGTVTIDNDLDLVIYSCTDVGVNEILVRGADYRLTEVTTTFTITVSPELHVTPQTLVIDELGNASINSTDFEPFGRVGCSTEPVTLQILNDSIFDCSHLNMISGAVSFLESDDVITIEENDSLDLSESFTLEAWFRTTEGSGFTRILRKPTANGRQNYSLLLQDGVPSVYYDRQPSGVVRADGLGPINDGLWHHIAGVRDGTQDSLKLYIDGVQVSSVYVAGLLPLQGNEGLFIGNGGVGQSQQLIGDIDALRIWERVLSASEIRQNQFRTLSGNEPGLVAAYDFEEAFLPNPQLDLNQLQAVSELTGNHDGTFTNANFNNRNANRAIGRQEVVLQGGTPTSTVMRDTTFVLLQDTSSVVITYVSDLEFTLDPAGNLTLEVEDLVADVSDNCEITQVLLNQNQFDCSHVGGINVGLTAIGPQGQLHREEVLITIQENDNPDLLVIPDTVNLVLIDGQSRAVTEADFGISGGPCGTLEVEDLTFSCADIENELFEIRATFNPLTGANQVLAIPARVSNVSTTIETFNLNISLYENTPDQLSSSVLYDSTVFTCSEPLDNDLLRIENQLLLSCDALNFTDSAVFFNGLTTIEFPETDNHVLDGNFTIEAWFRSRSTAETIPDGDRHIISATGQGFPNATYYGLTLNDGIPSAYYISNQAIRTSVFSNARITDEGWHHFAATLDTEDDVFSLYLDGNLVASRTAVTTPNTGTNRLLIGSSGFNDRLDDEGFLGDIDEVKIWDFAKSKEQIRDGVPRRPLINEEGLQLYFDMEDNLSQGFIRDKSTLTVTTGQVLNLDRVQRSIRRLGLQEAILLAEQPVTTATLDSVFTARNTSLIITQDMTPPEVLVRDSVTISLGAGGIVTLDAAQLIISANDFCGEITHILDRNTFDCTVNDTPQTVILTSTDLSGNIDLDTTVVTLESPVSYFNCGDPIFVFLEENGQASIREAVDSLEQITFSQIAVSRDTFDCTDLGFFDLEAVVTDPFSNVINTVISLFIIDTQDPVAQCVEPFSISLDRNGVATLDVSMIDNGSFDNCSFISSLSQTQFDSTNLGVNEIMLILEDDIGRRDTCSTEVTITGFLPPVATCQPTDTVFLDQNGNVAITTVDIYDGDVNNPDISELQLDRTSFDCSMTGEQSVTLTLTDFEGTITTCTTDLIVLDTIAPFANCVDPLIVELDSTGSVMLTAGEINNGSSDACSFVVSLSRSEFQLEDLGENLVELIISDPSGNTSTCSTIVTVRDQIAPQVEEASFSIIENSANGTVIGILSAVDQLGTNLQDWIISSGNSEGILALNSLSGEISIADNALLDAETINTISFGATVTDGNNTSQEQSFIVEVIDENDVIPVIIPNQEFIISASTVNGTPFGIPFAEDGDVSVTTFVDWAIVSGNDGGTFSIDPITGQIQVVDNALLEGVDSFMIGLTVSDGVNVSALETITIQLVTDNNPPIVVADQFFNMVENIENDVVVGVIQVTDQENNIIRDWQIVSGNDIGIFGISRDGLLTVIDNSTIDFESGKISYELGIVASDGIDQSEIENVLVNVVDVNDVFPVIDFGQEFTIRENSPNGFIIGALSASDGDITPTEFTDWLITNQTNDSLFVIDTATGELIVNSSELLDFINNPIIDLIVTVSDGVNTSEMTSVQIQVIEPGNLPPTIPSGQLFEIPENISNGDLVGTILATDLESDPLTWEIVSGNEAAIFHLNGNTGELTVNDNSLIDHEQEISYELMITVSDQELTSLESSIVVNVTDINDVAPNIEPGQQFAVFENSPNETLVGRVEAADGDSTPGVFVNWEIISGNEMGVFSIDPVAGTIHVANSENLNFELVDSYELEVRVSDAINLSDPETVVISVLNINDPPTISDIADLTVNSNEQAGPISFRVFDEDNSSDNLGVEFILDTEFPIASENVMINGTVEDKTITLTPTAEAQGITQVTLIVSDGILSDTTRFTVSVIQVSENSPPVGITLSSSSFAEEVPVNHEVGVLETIDADAFDNHTYELSEGAGDVDNDLFQIVGDRLLTNSLFDFEDQPTRTIRVRSTDSFGASIEMPFLLDLIPNPNLPLLVTNAFTPNGDGVNDTWYIDNISFHPDARIIVINDRGNVVFESIGYDTPWNGQFNGNILSFGVYYYSISLSNGVSLSGPLTIIR